MPIFNLTCPSCGEQLAKLMSAMKDFPCPKCQVVMVRTGTGPSMRVIEVRDNGFMPRKVEQLANVQEMIQQRSTPKKEPDKV